MLWNNHKIKFCFFLFVLQCCVDFIFHLNQAISTRRSLLLPLCCASVLSINAQHAGRAVTAHWTISVNTLQQFHGINFRFGWRSWSLEAGYTLDRSLVFFKDKSINQKQTLLWTPAGNLFSNSARFTFRRCKHTFWFVMLECAQV